MYICIYVYETTARQLWKFPTIRTVGRDCEFQLIRKSIDASFNWFEIQIHLGSNSLRSENSTDVTYINFGDFNFNSFGHWNSIGLAFAGFEIHCLRFN